MDDVVFVQVRDRAGERRRPRKTYNDLETRCDVLIENLRALEIARSFGLTVAINIIVDPSRGRSRSSTFTCRRPSTEARCKPVRDGSTPGKDSV